MKAISNLYTKRAFSKYSKGGFGKESSLANNFSFPRHKELFNEGYYEGEQEEESSSAFDDLPGK